MMVVCTTGAKLKVDGRLVRTWAACELPQPGADEVAG